MAVASYAPSPPSSAGPTREYRAAATFVIAATFMLVVLLLVVGSNPAGPPVRWAVAIVGPIVVILALFATAFGLAQRAEWATAAMTPLLYLLVLSGVFAFVLALTRSAFEIPLGLILAIWALRAPPSRSVPRGRVASGVVAVAVVAGLWALPAEMLLRPGGPLIVDASALQPSLQVTCAPPLGSDPARVHVGYDWRWLRGEPWPGGLDFVLLEAFVDAPEGGLETGFAIEKPDPVPAGIWQWDIAIFRPLGITYGIDIATAGFGPRAVGFSLIGPSNGSLGFGIVRVQATYVHGAGSANDVTAPGLWRVETSVDCEW